MTKQEEIREEAERLLQELHNIAPQQSHEILDSLFGYFHSAGCVLKVKCPKCGGHARPNTVTYNLHEGYCISGHSCPNCSNTGYVALESLLEDTAKFGKK